MIGISAYGGYIPRMRMQRAEIAKANAWLNPSLRGQAKGERSLANWDEDCVTMAVEAARDCLAGLGGAEVDGLYFASTSMPFADRLNAGIVAGALSLSEQIAAFDLGSCQRVGLSALSAALTAVEAGRQKTALVASAERRTGPAGSVAEISRGDAAAALVVSRDRVIAEYLGSVVQTVDFVDHYRAAGADFDYDWEERWVREEGYLKIVPPVLKRLLVEQGVSAEEVSHFIFPSPGNTAAALAKTLKINPEAVTDNLQARCGDSGPVHPLLMLSHVLETAQPGQLILVAAFGQGCEAMLLRVTEEVANFRPQRGVSGYLEQGVEESQYMKLLVFNRLVPYDKGMRAEFDRKAIISLMHRKRDFLEGFVGGKCEACGTVQIPRTRSCVGCGAFDTQQPHAFADDLGTVMSCSSDFLAYTVDPPHTMGIVQFASGGRMIMDMTDVRSGEIEVGASVRLVFRIKDYDDQRNFRRYFWKAMPALTSSNS